MLERDGYRCRSCGKAGRLEVDHIEPLWEGGAEELDNLQALCKTCHIKKHKRPRSAAEIGWDLHMAGFS